MGWQHRVPTTSGFFASLFVDIICTKLPSSVVEARLESTNPKHVGYDLFCESTWIHLIDFCTVGQHDGAAPSATQQRPTVGSEIEVFCGPLINYQHMTYAGSNATWHGSVLIVVKPTETQPRLEYGPAEAQGEHITVDGLKLYQDPVKAFWRFSLEVPLTDAEAEWTYTVPNIRFLSDIRKKDGKRSFFVPAAEQSMRIMFHSCNGFSVGTDEDLWSGRNEQPHRSILC